MSARKAGGENCLNVFCWWVTGASRISESPVYHAIWNDGILLGRRSSLQAIRCQISMFTEKKPSESQIIDTDKPQCRRTWQFFRSNYSALAVQEISNEEGERPKRVVWRVSINEDITSQKWTSEPSLLNLHQQVLPLCCNNAKFISWIRGSPIQQPIPVAARVAVERSGLTDVPSSFSADACLAIQLHANTCIKPKTTSRSTKLVRWWIVILADELW